MTRLNIIIPDPVNEWVEKRVASGGYVNADEYIGDLIRRDRAAADLGGDRWLAALNASFARGVAELDGGGGYDADEVFEALEAKYTTAMATDPR